MGRTIWRVNVKELTNVIRDAVRIVRSKLAGLTIFNANIEDVKNEVKQIFNSLKGVKFIGPTAVSKIMHLLHPDLFIMWDNDIRAMYKLGDTAEEYIRFLKMMQQFINEIINEYSQQQHISLDEVKERLERKFGGKPLTKIIDEYNWLCSKEGVMRTLEEIVQASSFSCNRNT